MPAMDAKRASQLAELQALKFYLQSCEISADEMAEALRDRASDIGDQTISPAFEEEVYIAIWYKYKKTADQILTLPAIIFGIALIVLIFNFFVRADLDIFVWFKMSKDELLFAVGSLGIVFAIVFVSVMFRDKRMKKIDRYFEDLSPAPVRNPKNVSDGKFNVPPQDD